MATIAVVYGSEEGQTAPVADRIAETLDAADAGDTGDEADEANAADARTVSPR